MAFLTSPEAFVQDSIDGHGCKANLWDKDAFGHTSYLLPRSFLDRRPLHATGPPTTFFIASSERPHFVSFGGRSGSSTPAVERKEGRSQHR
jgi:hypothetical protein